MLCFSSLSLRIISLPSASLFASPSLRWWMAVLSSETMLVRIAGHLEVRGRV